MAGAEPAPQTLLVLVHLRRNETFARLAAAFGVGTATAHRYVTEVVDLLAALAPTCAKPCGSCSAMPTFILDGTLIATDRLSGAGDRLFYSGEHRRHGVNVQFLTDPHGELLWASPALPGSTHDLTGRAIGCYADKGYVGAGGAISTPPACARRAASSANARSCATATTPRSARSASAAPPCSNAGTCCARPTAHPATSPLPSKPSSPCTTRANEVGISSRGGETQDLPKWSEFRADVVAVAGGEEAVAEDRKRNPAYIDGHRLAERPKAGGLSQTDMAEKMGVAKSRISQIERGEDSTVDAIARYVQTLRGQIQISAVFGDDQCILRGTDTHAA